MKNLSIFFLCMILGFGIVFGYKTFKSPKPNIKLQEQTKKLSHFSIETPPSESLKGTIATFSGEVLWQSRTATEGAKLQHTQDLQQGENIITKDTGTSLLDFSKLGSFSIMPNTKIEVIQTLPKNFVVSQDSGTVEYTKNGTIPLSIHALDLLVNPSNGTVTMQVDPDQSTITLLVASGSAVTAYEDTDTKTQTVTVNAGQTFEFDNNTKEASVQ